MMITFIIIIIKHLIPNHYLPYPVPETLPAPMPVHEYSQTLCSWTARLCSMTCISLLSYSFGAFQTRTVLLVNWKLMLVERFLCSWYSTSITKLNTSISYGFTSITIAITSITTFNTSIATVYTSIRLFYTSIIEANTSIAYSFTSIATFGTSITTPKPA